jgi:hypothetical protein
MKGAIMDKAVCVDVKCKWCGKISELVVPESGLEAYNNGEFIQVAFPELNADQREMLKTSICIECWSKIFGRGT